MTKWYLMVTQGFLSAFIITHSCCAHEYIPPASLALYLLLVLHIMYICTCISSKFLCCRSCSSSPAVGIPHGVYCTSCPSCSSVSFVIMLCRWCTLVVTFSSHWIKITLLQFWRLLFCGIMQYSHMLMQIIVWWGKLLACPALFYLTAVHTCVHVGLSLCVTASRYPATDAKTWNRTFTLWLTLW